MKSARPGSPYPPEAEKGTRPRSSLRSHGFWDVPHWVFSAVPYPQLCRLLQEVRMVRHKVIAPGMEYQRFPLVPRVFLDFPEEDGVIAAVKLFDVAAN